MMCTLHYAIFTKPFFPNFLNLASFGSQWRRIVSFGNSAQVYVIIDKFFNNVNQCNVKKKEE